MSLPWTGKTGLAKLATIFATGFLVSLGLCGANFVAVMSGFSGHPVLPNLLFITAWLEIAGMLVCAVGLLVIGIVMLVNYVGRGPKSPSE
jgi:hypothetical protein